jgi:hypothetical protein
MGIQTSFHADTGLEFLGLRQSRRGDVEVVYDNGLANRRIWRVITGGKDGQDALTPAQAQGLSDALRIAASAPRVLSALHDEMKKRAITLEAPKE